jgi:hypothetical protein
MAPRFVGLFTIIEPNGLQAYRIALPQEYLRLYDVFRVSLLEPHYGRLTNEERAAHMPPALLVGNYDEWEVDKILVTRKRRGRLQYLVPWKCFIDRYDPWEPERNLANATDLVDDFNRRKRQRKR